MIQPFATMALRELKSLILVRVLPHTPLFSVGAGVGFVGALVGEAVACTNKQATRQSRGTCHKKNHAAINARHTQCVLAAVSTQHVQGPESRSTK